LPDAVEEFLRIGNVGVNTGGGNGIPTYARAGIDLVGAHIRAGDLVLLDTGSANHDKRAFDDPYRAGRPVDPLSVRRTRRSAGSGSLRDGRAQLDLLRVLAPL